MRYADLMFCFQTASLAWGPDTQTLLLDEVLSSTDFGLFTELHGMKQRFPFLQIEVQFVSRLETLRFVLNKLTENDIFQNQLKISLFI